MIPLTEESVDHWPMRSYACSSIHLLAVTSQLAGVTFQLLRKEASTTGRCISPLTFREACVNGGTCHAAR